MAFKLMVTVFSFHTGKAIGQSTVIEEFETEEARKNVVRRMHANNDENDKAMMKDFGTSFYYHAFDYEN